MVSKRAGDGSCGTVSWRDQSNEEPVVRDDDRGFGSVLPVGWSGGVGRGAGLSSSFVFVEDTGPSFNSVVSMILLSNACHSLNFIRYDWTLC